jgi:5-methyltetrahydrofolate--homocysteine methyltransferase
VHDIGKNIVSVVLACNNYEIIDLGVMVPAEKIIRTALEEKVDMVGLSGLITPSLEEMVHVAREMERANLETPLLIGGATTSKIHTAVKIEQQYPHPVVHVKDASRSVTVASQLLSPGQKDAYVNRIREEYQELRERYQGAGSQVEYLTLEDARKNKLRINWDTSPIYKPRQLGIRVFKDYPLAEIREYISWIFFFLVWQLRGKWPDILIPNRGKKPANYTMMPLKCWIGSWETGYSRPMASSDSFLPTRSVTTLKYTVTMNARRSWQSSST